ncbi:MAG: uroporphyrinogen-III synthase [Gammaproteobacteria bacterium]|nr:uroporphyrinogen-III synthase [Gammaproteobacteria bacterium]
MSENLIPPGILILRPVQQARTTIDAVTAQGWRAVPFPTIEITPAENIDSAKIQEIINDADWLVFISQNAVLQFLELTGADFMQNQKIAAVGRATAQLLEDKGLNVIALPKQNFSTEGLLKSANFADISGQRIVIVRGNGGREKLADTLRERGAKVAYLEVYERRLADSLPQQLLPLWPDNINVIIATSNQLLDNLIALCKDILGDQLFQKPVVVMSERMRSHAREIGFQKIWLADRSSNDEIIKTISRNIAYPQNQL